MQGFPALQCEEFHQAARLPADIISKSAKFVCPPTTQNPRICFLQPIAYREIPRLFFTIRGIPGTLLDRTGNLPVHFEAKWGRTTLKESKVGQIKSICLIILIHFNVFFILFVLIKGLQAAIKNLIN